MTLQVPSVATYGRYVEKVPLTRPVSRQLRIITATFNCHPQSLLEYNDPISPARCHIVHATAKKFRPAQSDTSVHILQPPGLSENMFVTGFALLEIP